MTSSEKMTLWTIQNKNAWEEAEQKGVLKVNEAYAWEYFHQPYRWLVGQMERRIQDYEGGYPVWAWPNDEKPDLRRAGLLEPGAPGVRIGFNANPKDVLLSDLDAWHSVLSGHYLDITKYDTKYGYHSVWNGTDEDQARTGDIIKSWERIFDLEALKQHDDNGEQTLQATIGSVALNQVISVKYFTAR